MKTRLLSRYALSSCVAAAMLAGCGGSQPPIGASGAMAQTSAVAMHSGRGKSWMKQGSSSGDLIYAPGGCGGTCVVSYPDLELVGSLTASGEGVCADTQGNVFLTAGATVTEFAHGGTSPIAILSVDGNLSQGCSVDPLTNNLAVVYEGHDADIAIFANEQGKPAVYSSKVDAFYCGYDNRGNLFVDGISDGQPGFSELPTGSSQFTQVSIPYEVGLPGQVQWDGSHITYESVDQSRQISRLSISGSSATVVGITKFKAMRHRAYPSWIIGTSKVVVPYNIHGIRANVIGIWKYPEGGAPIQTIRKFPSYKKSTIDFTGVAFSVAP